MIGFIKTLISKKSTKKESDQPKRLSVDYIKAPEILYYKALIPSHYGICGAKVEFGRCQIVTDGCTIPSGLVVLHKAYYHQIGFNGRIYMTTLFYIAPKGAKIISREEYLEGVEK